MYLVYLGESGNTGNSVNDDNQRHHVFTGLLVHESQSVSMNGEFNALCRRHFGAPLGEPGAPKEIRPADLYQGRGPFTSLPQLKRIEIIQDCLGILLRRETPVIASYIDKQQFSQARSNQDNPSSMWQKPSEPIISRFLFALNMLMDDLNMSNLSENQMMESEWPVNDFALVVAGNDRSVEPKFLTEYLKSDQGMDSTAVLECFCYVGAQHSACAQLANMCAYFTRRWLQLPSQSNDYFDILREGKVIQVIYPVQI